MKTFVIGDIHGHYDALKECLELSGFNNETDKLICLGDVCDRGLEVLECIKLLSTIKNLVYILGNHDDWTQRWLTRKLETGELDLWTSQGGKETINSITQYNTTDEHKEFILNFLNNSVLFHVEDRTLFVHGGIVPNTKAEQNDKYDLMWNRDMCVQARYNALDSEPFIKEYDEVFCGHCTTLYYGSDQPRHYNNVWMLDTGICYNGKLTIMDIKTKQYWQSDK